MRVSAMVWPGARSRFNSGTSPGLNAAVAVCSARFVEVRAFDRHADHGGDDQQDRNAEADYQHPQATIGGRRGFGYDIGHDELPLRATVVH